MKTAALTLTIVLCLGYSLQTNAQREIKPKGMTVFQLQELVMRTQEVQRQREIAQREVEARMALKRKGDDLNTIYKKLDSLLVFLGQEQSKQFQFEVQGITDIKQDVIVSKLTEELKNEVEKLWKINRK